MRKTLLLLAAFFLCFNSCYAEITCECGLEHCTCFIQLGDGGPEMEYIQHALIAQGYLLKANDAYLFDEHTLQAVIDFQKANSLFQTGMLDDETLTLLLWGMLPAELDNEKPLSNGNPIWIPTDGGIRRHSKPTCCKMLDPRRVSVRNADLMNMLPCGICNRNGRHE